MRENPYLVQRLQRPYKGKEGGLIKDDPNIFSFGGGFKNGGLSKQAMDIFKELFRFDYMGAAEFEFGAVPKAFQAIAQNAEKKRTPGLQGPRQSFPIRLRHGPQDQEENQTVHWQVRGGCLPARHQQAI
jgi:hypothetical protein